MKSLRLYVSVASRVFDSRKFRYYREISNDMHRVPRGEILKGSIPRADARANARRQLCEDSRSRRIAVAGFR